MLFYFLIINFVIRNLQTKFACLIKLELVTFFNSMNCPTQKSFNEKISRFLEKMLFNVFGIHLNYLPNAHFSNEINSIAPLTNYYRLRKEYLS